MSTETHVQGLERRVFGPPGTGKTTFLTEHIFSILQSGEYAPEDILIASFTKTAAAEIAGRDLPLQDRQIGTLHAHCFRALGHPKIAESLILEFNNTYPWLAISEGKESAIDEGSAEMVQHTDGDKLFSQYQILRARMVARDSGLWPENVLSFAQKWETWKDDLGLRDFTDLIEQCLLYTDHAPDHPRVMILDECQDFTALETALCRKWARRADYALYALDDDQCIFAFKGASPYAVLDLPIPDVQKQILAQSYRVPRVVQAHAEKWIQRLKRREPKEYRPRDFDGELRRLPKATTRIPEYAVEDAARYVSQGKSVMFLTSCSYMLEPLKHYLRENGFLFHNPYRRTRGDWNPTQSHGVNAVQRLLAFLRPQESVWGAKARMWTAKDLAQWIDPVTSEGVLKHGAKTKIKAEATVEVEVPIERLLEYFNDDALAYAMDGDVAWYHGHMTDAKKKMLDYPLRIVHKEGAKVLFEKPKIIIGTIHSVKGGESDCVYVFPDLSIPGATEWQLRGEGRDAIIRQFYVGMTRARESLILCGGAGIGNVDL